MSTAVLAWTDTRTMVRRSLLHMLRYRVLTVLLVGEPVIFLLLLVYVFGGARGGGIGPGPGGRQAYLEYITPTMLIFTVTGSAQGAAINVAMDLTTGIVARFRTMSIGRSAFLVGHAFGTLIQSMLAGAIVLGVAVLIGFRGPADPIAWVAAFGLLALSALALTWFCIALGIACGSVETASKVPMLIVLLPFLGNGFVPTDSMPFALRLFAEYQPFTPIIDALRALLGIPVPGGSPLATSGPLAVAWCVAITVVGSVWSVRAYERRSMG